MTDRRILNCKQRHKYVIVDFMTSAIAFFVFNVLRFDILDAGGDVWKYLGSVKLVAEQCVAPFLMLGIYWLSGYYNCPFEKSRLQEFLVTLFSAAVNTTLIFLILLINDRLATRSSNYELIIISFVLFSVTTYAGRLWFTLRSSRRLRKNKAMVNCIIVGNSDKARETAKNLNDGKGRYVYSVRAFVNIPGENQVEDNNPVYDFEFLEDACREMEVDQVVISPERYDEKKVMQILSNLFSLEIPVKIAPDTYSFVTSAIRMKDIYGEPFVDLTSPSISESSKNVKRFSDVLISSLVLVALSPVLAVIAMLVKRSSHGPVIYSQERIGLHRRPFLIYKFRTMKEDAETGVPLLSGKNDARVTRIGRFLRKYRLDELPQFWNVIKGDMSIVGPRPEREYFIRQIMEKAPYYALVYQVRPGITSWGMVKYGYASNLMQMIDRTRYDLIYITNMSIFVDIKILIYTVKTILTGKGM